MCPSKQCTLGDFTTGTKYQISAMVLFCATLTFSLTLYGSIWSAVHFKRYQRLHSKLTMAT